MVAEISAPTAQLWGFVDNHTPAGFSHRRENGVVIQRIHTGNIDDFTFDVLFFKGVSCFKGFFNHGAPAHQSDVVTFPEGEAGIQWQGLAIIFYGLCTEPVDSLGLKKNYRVRIADCCQQEAVCTGGDEGITTLMPGICASSASVLSE